MTNSVKYFFLVLWIFSSYCLFAQKDARVEKILQQMNDTYTETPSFKATVKQEIIDTQAGLLEEMTAEITIKGDMYRLVVGEQEIYNNHKTVWTYLKDLNEVSIDNYYPDADDGLQSPRHILNMYKQGFKYLYLGEKKAGGTTLQLVDLSPEADNKRKYDFFKVTLYIDKEKKTLKRWEVHEKGNRRKYNYLITKFDNTIIVDDAYFEFDQATHKGIEVIDFR